MRERFPYASFYLVSQTSVNRELFFSHLSLPFFIFSSTRISREIQSVSQQIQNCLVNPAGYSANMKILQKSLGRPLPFKVSVLCLQRIFISRNVQIGFNICTALAFQDSQTTIVLCLLDWLKRKFWHLSFGKYISYPDMAFLLLIMLRMENTHLIQRDAWVIKILLLALFWRLVNINGPPAYSVNTRVFRTACALPFVQH